MNQYPLTHEQIDFYRENGYVALPDLLTPEELTDLNRSADEVLQAHFGEQIHVSRRNPEYEKIFIQKVNLWRVHEGIHRHVFNPKIAEVARRLAGVQRIRIWHDHLLTKMPGDNKPTAWHQDLPYWPMNESGGQLSCWVALQDVNEQNGCMWFVPGSHRFGKFEPINLITPQDLFAFVPNLDPEKHQPVPVPLKAGSCTFHNGLTFHYAGQNHSDKPRRAMVTIYMPDGTTYSGKAHIVTDAAGIPVGATLEGDLFPVLADTDTCTKVRIIGGRR